MRSLARILLLWVASVASVVLCMAGAVQAQLVEMTIPLGSPVLTGALQVAVDANGNVYVLQRGVSAEITPSVVKVDPTGREVWRVGPSARYSADSAAWTRMARGHSR